MNSTKLPAAVTKTDDQGRITVGAGGRLPAAKPANVADAGRVSVGAGGRLVA